MKLQAPEIFFEASFNHVRLHRDDLDHVIEVLNSSGLIVSR
jgi:hypothetical protein